MPEDFWSYFKKKSEISGKVNLFGHIMRQLITRRSYFLLRLLFKKYNLQKHLYFCEKQVDSFLSRWYTPTNLRRESIEARCA